MIRLEKALTHIIDTIVPALHQTRKACPRYDRKRTYHVSAPVSKEYRMRELIMASKLTQRNSEIQTTAYGELTLTSRLPCG